MKEKSEDVICCTPLDATAPIKFRALEGPEADDELAKLAKAIGHPARVRIIRMLSRKEARVCSQIVDELPLAQSTVSEHLRILKEAGLDDRSVESYPIRTFPWQNGLCHLSRNDNP